MLKLLELMVAAAWDSCKYIARLPHAPPPMRLPWIGTAAGKRPARTCMPAQNENRSM